MFASTTAMAIVKYPVSQPMLDTPIFMFGVLLSILLTIWVYVDAQAHSRHPAILWALITFFGGIIGLLLYLIIGRDWN